MDNLLIIVLIVAVLIIVGAAWMYMQKQKSQKLRSKFGPEYDRAVVDYGDRNRAEKDLQERKKRVESFNIRPLSPQDRNRFAQAWQNVQSRFVDAPRDAVAAADNLVSEVMNVRGYPVSDFEQRTADISVDHPELVENYRIAHDIAENDKRGEASTEDLRRAMVHFRGLFEELLEGYMVAEPEEVRR